MTFFKALLAGGALVGFGVLLARALRDPPRLLLAPALPLAAPPPPQPEATPRPQPVRVGALLDAPLLEQMVQAATAAEAAAQRERTLLAAEIARRLAAQRKPARDPGHMTVEEAFQDDVELGWGN